MKYFGRALHEVIMSSDRGIARVWAVCGSYFKYPGHRPFPMQKVWRYVARLS